MSRPAARISTFEEIYRQIEALPKGVTGEILEPGVLRTMSRPGGPHRFAAWRLRRTLQGHDLAEGGAGWWFEVYQTTEALAALVLVAKDDDVAVLPPFDGELHVGRWWKPRPPRAE